MVFGRKSITMYELLFNFGKESIEPIEPKALIYWKKKIDHFVCFEFE